MVRCPNRECAKYDADVAFEWDQNRNASSTPSAPLTGAFDPGDNRIEFRYRNAFGDEKAFVGDRTTIRRRGVHVSICLAPTGARCAFALSRILDRSDVEAAIPPEDEMSGTDRQILAYHRKHGTTSSRYEELKARLGMS
jgi:hypothetical protein